MGVPYESHPYECEIEVFQCFPCFSMNQTSSWGFPHDELETFPLEVSHGRRAAAAWRSPARRGLFRRIFLCFFGMKGWGWNHEEWMGLSEHLQESMDFPMIYAAFRFRMFPQNQSMDMKNGGFNKWITRRMVI